eukprot:c17506_g1_i2.p1 GENE.c17506_g1_i2~~c17506_g1_i2.p1  ORF type:complete len:157 (+),score=23.43 c17506_g1_i2:2-472(+)
MVRVGTLPFRLLCLEYGADLVYTEEMIDKRLMKCERRENAELGCVDYVLKKESTHKVLPSDLSFRCAPHLEKDRLVVQLGTNDPITALQAAQNVVNDCAVIDVNMGCPMKFSKQMGAGSELLKHPQCFDQRAICQFGIACGPTPACATGMKRWSRM